MKTLRTFIEGYKSPLKYFHNPNIDDWLYINDIDTNDISEELQLSFENSMWHDILGPKYDLYQENVVYENLTKSYDPSELISKLYKKYGNIISKPRHLELVKPTKTNSFTIEVTNNDIVNDDEFKSLLNFYNYYVSFCEKRNNVYEVYIEPYRPDDRTSYIYDDCKGIVYRLVDNNGLKRIKQHGLVPRHDIDRYYPRYIFVFTDLNAINQVKNEIKKKTKLHLIKIDLNKYKNKLKFYVDPTTVNYEAFITREYIPKYCCEEIRLKY